MSTLAKLMGAGGGLAEMWAAARVVQQGELVVSPLDLEVYRRKTATGAGATDPADDLTNYIAVSYVRSTALPLKQSAWITIASAGSANYAYGIVKTVPGAIANGVRTSVLSLTGRGGVGFLGVYTPAVATVRVEVVCDGRTIYDVTSAAMPSGASALTLIGNTFPGQPPGASVANQEGFGSLDNNGPRFRRSLQVFLTPTVGTFNAAGALAASYWSES